MRKSLLIAAATLAAGVISSQAGVYSQNIVGYVNASYVGSGYVNIANPLDNAAGNNNLTNVIPNPVIAGSGILDGAALYIWNGSGYSLYSFDSGAPGGFDDASGAPMQVGPSVAPGSFFYMQNTTGNAITNTYVGAVHVDASATGTQTIGTTTNIIQNGYNFLASKLPIGGGITSVLQISNTVVAGNGVLDGAAIYVPKISTTGAFQGYSLYSFDSGSSTGFDDNSGNPGAPEPQIPVGQGFIIQNTTGAAYTWIQTY